MKKIIIALALICVLSLFFLPYTAFADESEPTTPPETETEPTETPLEGDSKPTDGETVTVDKVLWEEITTLLERIKTAETPSEVEDIVKETIFTRLTEWFGENAKTVAEIVLTVVLIVWSIINRKDKPKLYAGLNTSYMKIKEVAEQNDLLNNYVATIKEKLQLNENESKIAEISANGALQIANLLVQNSNLATSYKELAQTIYNDCNKKIVEVSQNEQNDKQA